MASLREYVLVAQKEVRVEHYLRRGSEWIVRELRARDEVLRLASINCALPVPDIYENVKWEEPR